MFKGESKALFEFLTICGMFLILAYDFAGRVM